MKRWMWVVVLTVILILGVGRRVWAEETTPPPIPYFVSTPTTDGGYVVDFLTDDSPGGYYVPPLSAGGLGGSGGEGATVTTGPHTQGAIIGGTADHPVISGYYESTTRPGYYVPIQVKPVPKDDGGGGPPRCPCGTMQKECTRDCNGDDCTKSCEQYCAPDCGPGT
jgi:hypothetical protein